MNKNGRLIIMTILLVLSVGLAVVGFVLLPDTIIVQLTATGQPAKTMPKLLAVGMSLALSTPFAIAYYASKNSKFLLVSAVGLLIGGLNLALNIMINL